MPVSTTVIPIPSITNENSSAVIIQDSIPPHSITDNDDDSPISTSKSTKDINVRPPDGKYFICFGGSDD
nr:14785_t:CDS:2 [Entrophospora candida]